MKKQTFCLLAASAFLTISLRAAIPVYSETNAVLTFDAIPAVADWSSLSISGGGGDVSTSAGMETEVQLLTAASVTTVLGSSGTQPPSQSGVARWNSAGFYLQTRPTGNKYLVLMATLTNLTGANVPVLDVDYDWNQGNPNPVDESTGLAGHRTYFSLTGAADSWHLIPEFSTFNNNSVAQSLSAQLNLLQFGGWPADTKLYLLWADDNGPGGTSNPQEGAYSIDNFVANPGVMAPLDITQQPAAETSVEQFAPTNLSATVTGSFPRFQWYAGDLGAGTPIGGATASELLERRSPAERCRQLLRGRDQ